MDPANRTPRGESRSRFKSGLERPGTWAIAWLVWFAMLCILSSMSHPGPKINVAGIDKLEHAIFFAFGGTLLLLAIALRGKKVLRSPDHAAWGRLAMSVFLAGAVVGGIDEWHQSYTPGRQGLDVYDWIADVIGSLAALPIARFVLRRLAARDEGTCPVTRDTP